MNLTEHFTVEEFIASDTAVRLGIDNMPQDGDVIIRMTKVAQAMEQVRKILGAPIKINSGYRCEELERVLCAKDFAAWCKRHGCDPILPSTWNTYFARKAHPKGMAVDFVCPGFGLPIDIVRAIAKTDIKFDQCIQEGDWVHMAFGGSGAREVLTATFVDGTPTYTQGA